MGNGVLNIKFAAKFAVILATLQHIEMDIRRKVRTATNERGVVKKDSNQQPLS